jgi:hypothetical protein
MAMGFFYRAAGAIWAPFRYAQREIENAKEDLKEDAREAAADVLKLLIICLCAIFFLIFGSITAASAINSSSDSAWLGFATVACFYLVVAIGVYVWKQASKQKKHDKISEHHRALN